MEQEQRAQLLREILEVGFAGGESLTSLREKLGIDGKTWEAWLRDGGMPEDIVGLARAMAEMCAPWVWSSLLALTREGSIPAMKLYFELCRERNPSAASVGERSLGDQVLEDREIVMLRQEILETAGAEPLRETAEGEPGGEDGGGCG